MPFAISDDGLLIRFIGETTRIVVPVTLRQRVLHMGHHPKWAGHPGGRKMYYTLRRDWYWPSLALDCYSTVRACTTCAKTRIQLRKHTTHMKLFPSYSPIDFVAIDILGELIRSKNGNRHLLVISDRCTKLVRTVPLNTINAKVVAHAFVHNWVFVYGSPRHLLSDNGAQFTSRFMRETCRILGTQNVFTTTYNPKYNGQVERFNRTIVAAIRHYVGDNPRTWDKFTDALT